MTRITASRRPCTFGNTAGIHEFIASVFMSLVIRPLRNITASEPLTSRRPREERSITPAPPSRTAEYSVDGIGWLTVCQFTLGWFDPVATPRFYASGLAARCAESLWLSVRYS